MAIFWIALFPITAASDADTAPEFFPVAFSGVARQSSVDVRINCVVLAKMGAISFNEGIRDIL
jgi:hypothetical protein